MYNHFEARKNIKTKWIPYNFSYKQRRFNLFREESEGYAKLITELNNESIEHTSVHKVLEIVKSLIGTNCWYDYYLLGIEIF